jgi:hypothetical protein
MTYNEVMAMGAEILDAFVKSPTEGWTELAVEQVRQIHEDATRQVQELAGGFNAGAYDEASLLKNSSGRALERAQLGARLFGAYFEDGTLALAAIKTACTQCA